MEIGGDGKVGTVPGSITEKQEGNQQCFLCVFICRDSNGFLSLCKTSMECNQEPYSWDCPVVGKEGEGPEQMPSSQEQHRGLCRKWTLTEHLRSARKWADDREPERSGLFQ